jgi:hypothetical protein
MPPTPTPPSGYCPNGWERLGDNCYLFDESLSPRSFDAASYECQSRFGARLASVHSNEELEFIAQRAGEVFTASTIWIGMQRWEGKMAIPFTIYTPPVDYYDKVFHRGSVNFIWIRQWVTPLEIHTPSVKDLI